MGQVNQNIAPLGGMNTDDDVRLLGNGDYRYAENIRNATSDESYVGAFENILGNLKISNNELNVVRILDRSIIIPNTAIHTSIGSCIDITTNCVYYFVHTSPFNVTISSVVYEYVQDAIYEINLNTNVITTILKDGNETSVTASVFFDNLLNFSLDHLMNGAYVVDGKLYWNDGYNPPRKVNIARAKAFTTSINTRYSFTDNYFAGNVGFVVSQTTYNALNIGDRIQIFQNRGATYADYDGTTQIINKLIDGTTYVIVIQKPYLGATTPEGGFIYLNKGGYSIPFKEVFMDRIKYPPTYPLYCTIGNDTTKSFNYIADKQFQFSYKYIYDDKEESTLSHISEIPLMVVDVINDVFSYNEPKINNVIYLKLNTGENNVKGIKIYARSTSVDSSGINPVSVNCNNSDWWLVDEVIKYNDSDALIIDDNTEYVYKFYNSQNKQYGDQADLNRPFDYVPQICETSEIVENSRIVDGDITEGYDNVDMNANIDIDVYNYISTGNYTSAIEVNTYTGQNPQQSTDKWRHHYKEIEIPTTVEIGDIFKFYITKNEVSSHFNNDSFSITITPFIKNNYPIELKKEILNQLSIRNIIGWKEYNLGTPYYSMLYNYCIISNLPQGGGQDYIQKPSWDNTIIGSYSLSTSYQRYIGSSDKLYTLTTQTITDFTTNAPYSDYKIYITTIYRAPDVSSFQTYRNPYELLLVDFILQKTTTSTNFQLNKPLKSLKVNSSNSIGIVYFDRALRCGFVNKIGTLDIPSYREIKNVLGSYITTNDIVIYPRITINNTPPSWATHYAIAYTPLVNYEYFLQYFTNNFLSETNEQGQLLTKISLSYIKDTNSKKNKTIIEPYIYTKGDRLRVITKVDGKTIITTKEVDAEIVKSDLDWIWVEGDIVDGVNITTVQAQAGTGWLYEIYRPKKENKEELYYITPNVFSCENGNHSGNIQNQTSSQPAVLQLEIGDVYRVYCPFSVSGWLERKDAYYSYLSNGLDIGRPNIVNINAKRQRLFNHLRYSGKLFENTQINNLSTNYASDYIQVSSKFGAITKLMEVGYVLKVLQEKNLNSVYLSRTQLTNTDGSTNLSAINTPLGTINPSEKLYGSKYHKSVLRNNRSLYFLDTLQGAFIKDDNNGSEQISENYKMNRYFTDLCKKIESGLYKVDMASTYDVRHEEAIFSVSLKSLTLRPSEYYTIAFSELKNKFTTFYTYYPEHLENLGQQLMSFKNGEVWLHNKTTNYNQFYGTSYPQKITIVGNQQPNANKVFTNMSIRTTAEWEAPVIKIAPTLNYPSGMLSRLKKNKFKNKEGVQYVAFMNDMTDPRYANEYDALVNGRPLRGEAIEVELQNSEVDKAVTLMFTIGMTISERNL